MNRVALWLIAGGLLALAGPVAAADPPTPKPARPEPSAEAAALAERIDKMLADTWAKQGIAPAEPATDAEFLRRVYLDLVGRIPTVAEARAFLADKRENKRARLIVELLFRPAYAKHFTTVWRHLLLPEANTNPELAFIAIGFDSWLREQFAKNVPYDQMVRELMTVPINPESTQMIYNFGAMGKSTPIAFY